MSAVKTLVPAPAAAPDAPRNARGAFAIPIPRMPLPAATRNQDAEASFHSLFSQVAQRAADSSAQASDASRNASVKKRDQACDNAANGSERAAASEEDARSERSSRAAADREVDRKKRRTEDDASANDTTPSGDTAQKPAPDRADGSDQANASSDAADGAADPQAGQDAQPADGSGGSQPEASAPAEKPVDPSTILLRQLGQLANAGAQAQSASVAAAPAPAARADAAATRQTVQPVDPQATRNEADSQAAQLVGAKVPSHRLPGEPQVGRNASQRSGPVGPAAPGLGVTASSSSSPTDELARLLAVAAGLADSGTPDSTVSQTGRGLDAPSRPDPRQIEQLAAGGTQVRVGSAPAGSSASPVAGGAGTASFASLLARSSAAPTDSSTSLDHVAELVRANVGAKNSTITIRLDPPDLGQIQLDARLRDDVLSIHIQADNAAARDLLHSRMDDLRQALSRHGITVDRFDIEPRPASPSSHGQGANEHRPGWQHQQSADGGMPDQWQQPDSSRSSHDGSGSAQSSDTDAMSELAPAGSQADSASEGMGAAASIMPGAPGATVNVWA